MIRSTGRCGPFSLLPDGLASGVLGIVFIGTGVRFLYRYLTTADPFNLTGWNRWRRRDVTTYQGHRWWGIFGAIIAGIGIFFVIDALRVAGG